MTSRENCPFVLWIGNRRLIKRQVFDEYIANMYSI
ncbi:MAG: excisionase [Oscillospiraceae bacterium]